MRFFIVLFLVAYGCALHAQSFLFLGREDPFSSPIDVVDFTPTNCSLTPNCTVANSEAAPFFIIVYSPTGTMYTLDILGKKLFKYEEANIQYEVTATTGFGCTTTQTIRVIVLERGAFFVPNVLSRSDADPRNRVFNFFSDDPGLLVECAIADRWGGLVMHENGLKPNFWAGWDGTWRGKHLSPGVYMYSLVLTKPDNPAFRENIIGTVTIAD